VLLPLQRIFCHPQRAGVTPANLTKQVRSPCSTRQEIRLAKEQTAAKGLFYPINKHFALISRNKRSQRKLLQILHGHPDKVTNLGHK
jgi:hypothetical protein